MHFQLLNIISWLDAHQLPCLIKAVFKVECPTCGIQRSMVALLKGDFMNSIKLYPALLPVLIFLFMVVFNNRIKLVNMQKFIKFGIPFIFIIILLSYLNKLTT